MELPSIPLAEPVYLSVSWDSVTNKGQVVRPLVQSTGLQNHDCPQRTMLHCRYVCVWLTFARSSSKMMVTRLIFFGPNFPINMFLAQEMHL